MQKTSNAVILTRIGKRYAGQAALTDLSLMVNPGEVMSLLGPSGCGKTTALRIVAGFVTPDAGTVTIGGEDMGPLAPERRPTALVFQSYALWPHKSVAENIAFGLRVRRLPRAGIRAKVHATLKLLALEAYRDRYPSQLSGGQQQRVALARALAVEPQVLLLDEPFSALDAALRQQAREELRALQRRIGITTLYVTHDQEEALALSDRIAVIQAGRTEQVGTPEAVYERPDTLFVATFIGTTNLLAGTVVADIGHGRGVRLADGTILCVEAEAVPPPGTPVTLAYKAEALAIGQPHDRNAISGIVDDCTYRGGTRRYTIASAVGRLILDTPHRFASGERLTCIFPPARGHIVPAPFSATATGSTADPSGIAPATLH